MTPARNRHAASLSQPWAPGKRIYCAPGRITVKLLAGEAPEHIPTREDVRLSGAAFATAMDGNGAVDRTLRKFSDRIGVSRLHTARRSVNAAGRGHHQYDAVEHAIGLSRTFQVELDEDTPITDLIDALRHLRIVAEASPCFMSVLPFHDEQATAITAARAWQSREQIRAAEAMAYDPGDPTVIVAIVDTGVMADHPEIAAKLRRGYDAVDFTSDHLAGGITLIGEHHRHGSAPNDWVGHGTACASIIGGVGERIPPGMAGNCSTLAVRVLAAAQMPGRDQPVGIGAIPDIDAGVKRAIDLGAKVLNFSFGTPLDGLDANDPLPHSDVVRYAIAHGCLMVAAAGNTGTTESMTPAVLEGVIAVGAVDADDHPCHFTTRGSHVALCAPGDHVWAAALDGYQMATGTSFAAPFVTAAVALLVARAEGRGESITAMDAARLLRTSARPWKRDAGDVSGCGSGILDVLAALQALDRDLDGAPDDPPISDSS